MPLSKIRLKTTDLLCRYHFLKFFWVFGLWKKQKCLKHTKVEFRVSKHCRIQEQRNKNKHEQRFFIFEKKSTILFNNATLNSILSDRNFDDWRYRPFKIDRHFDPSPIIEGYRLENSLEGEVQKCQKMIQKKYKHVRKLFGT